MTTPALAVGQLVAVGDGVMVDPTEVDVLSGDSSGVTRIYLRGAGRWAITVRRPLADVVQALAQHQIGPHL